MTKRLIFFWQQLKRYRKSPAFTAWFTLLILLAALLLIDVFFLPWPAIVAAVVIFLGLAVFFTYSELRLAGLDSEFSLKSKELETLIDDMADGVLIYDANFKILSLNRAAEKIFGTTADILTGKTLEPGLVKNPAFKIITQVVFPSLAPTVAQISENDWPQIVDINLDDPPLKLRTILSKITDVHGRAIGFLKMIHDQTREEEILQSKSEFIAIAAHQLRTPLTAIHWAFENLNQSETKPELKETIKEGTKLAERSLKIINDLLDVAKIEEGKFGYRSEEINLNELTEEVLRQTKSFADEYGIKLYFSADQKYVVEADTERLGIVLTNLIDNAIKYNTKNGNVTIALTKQKDRPFVKVNVQDTGVGIPETEIKKMFTKFYRGTNIAQIEPNGSGLGLYIAKNIIERFGGEIGVESILGRGSVFWFTLPLKKPSSA